MLFRSAKALLGCRKTRSRATVANHRQGGAMTRIGDRHCVGETEHILETRWCRLSALPCVGLIRQNHLQTLHPSSMDVDDERDACKSGVKVARPATSSTPSRSRTLQCSRPASMSPMIDSRHVRTAGRRQLPATRDGGIVSCRGIERCA